MFFLCSVRIFTFSFKFITKGYSLQHISKNQFRNVLLSVMEEFNDYWDILPNKSIKVEKELKEFLSCAILQRQNNDYPNDDILPNFNTDSSSDLSSEAIQFLRFSLNDHPYPSFLLVNILKKEAPYEKVFDDLEYYTIANAVENVSESKEYGKVYCMLANVLLHSDKYERFCMQVLPVISDRINSGILSSTYVVIALLSRNDDLIRRFLQFEENLKIQNNCKKYIFNQLTLKNLNCLFEYLTFVNHHNFKDDHELSQYSRAIKLIEIFNNQAVDDIDINILLKRIEPLLEEIDDPSKNDLLKLYLLELRREHLLMDFLNENSSVNFVNVCHFSRQRKILYELLENVNISYSIFEKLKPVVNGHHEYMHQILEIHNPKKIVPRKDELEYFSIVLCVKLVTDLINIDENQEDYMQVLNQNISNIKEISKNIKDMSKRLRFCEILFTLLFIRFEDLSEGALPFHPPTYTNDFDTSDIDDHNKVMKFCSRVSSKTGFMTCESLARAILNFIKTYLLRIKRSHAFIEETEVNRDRHTNILDSVNDALYRFSIITKCMSQFIGGNLKVQTFHLDTLLKPHQVEDSQNLSTDEEQTGQKYYVGKRRTKRPKKNRMSSDSDKTSYSTTNSTTNGSENVLLDMKRSYTSERLRPRKIINKMLSSPDTLATLCASRGDMIELKNVIKNYQLFNTPADHYVRYMDKFEEQKLIMTSALKKKKNDSNNENISEKQFEASKIATFAYSTPIIQRQEELDLLEKYKPSYKFLRLYEIDGMKIVSLVDLMLSLPCNFPQNQYLYTQIIRHFDRLQNFDRTDLQSYSYVPFCYNLMEYLESYKHVYDKEITIQELLTSEFYPFNGKELSQRICKLELYLKLNKFNMNSFTSVEALEDKCYQMFEVFKFDINYYQRLFNYLNSVKKLLEFHPSEFDFSPDSLLMLDLDTIIGEIVNVEKVPPMEIEDLVIDLGKNLVHVLINYNLCPVIKQSTLLAIDEQGLLEYLDSCLKTEVCDVAKYDSNESSLKMESSYLLPCIERTNIMAAQLIREVHSISADKDFNLNMKILKHFSLLPQIQVLSKLYQGNVILATLNYDNIDLRLLHKYLISTANKKEAVHVIESIKEIQYKKHQISFEKIKDIFLVRLIDASENEDDYWYLCKIVNFNLKSEYVNKHLHKIKDSTLVRRLLKDLLSESYDKCLLPTYITQIKKWIHELDIYDGIALVLGDMNWLEVRQKSIDEPDVMLHELLDNVNDLLTILPNWIKLHPLIAVTDPLRIRNIYDSFSIFVSKNENQEVIKVLFDAIETMSCENILGLYEILLMGIKNLQSLKYVVDYLYMKAERNEKFQKYQITIKMLETLKEHERQNVWHLMTRPLLVIEQFLMNSRFEILSKMLSVIKPMLIEKPCKLCHDSFESNSSSGSLNISNLTRLIDISNSGSSDYIMINYDSNHIDEFITMDCVNVMLRIYASKALDIRISEKNSAASYSILSRMSVESPRSPNQHNMPKEAPPKESWVVDDDAGICMCCNKAIFTLLTRRHHCRRCGRVVCHTCSSKRVLIPELYADVLVRACNDCYYQMELEKDIMKKSSISDSTTDDHWQFTGNAKHDSLVRDEFSYEYAPNVNLCLSISDLYLSETECAQFLLDQARKLENLFRPLEPGHVNSEMDYELVAKMIHCLAVAAKVRGASDECNEIIAHSDIMQALVENKCESLMPMESINVNSIRKLRDTLIRAEQWQLALEVSTKYRFPTVGVMASWGIVCLKAGCFMTAREKFAHCFKHVESCTTQQESLISFILSDEPISQKQLKDWEQIKRPTQSPGLLNEIINIIENSYHITTSTTSTPCKNISNSKEVVEPNEPAFNIVNRLKNLKNITQNNFDDVVAERKMFRETRTLAKDAKGFIYKNQIITSKLFDEALFYLNSYASHSDIIDFLIKHYQIVSALRYILVQKIDAEMFIQKIYYPCLKQNNIDIIIDYMMDLDETLLIWKNYILQLCRHLEKRSSWKELYEIQVLIKDPIRASMTCIKFYTMNCKNYRDLFNNRQHLIKAQKHLEAEFELASHWEDIKMRKDERRNSLIMKRDMKSLGNLLRLMSLQLEVVQFLAQSESDGIDICGSITKICAETKSNLPTLFDGSREKLILAVLLLVHGNSISSGFTLSSRIIHEYSLNDTQVYGICAKYLATNDRINEISNLIQSIQTKDMPQTNHNALSDEILSLSIKTGYEHYGNLKKNELIALIPFVKEIGTKVMCYIYTNQLKSAYLLAVKYDRINDIKKILRQAELTDQKQVKKLCEKKLAIAKSETTNNV
uniref:CSON013644 protein n=1 Tax=Culicoides sonorensis TaxID=179676 RepID=A0A336LL81_CULSO